MVKKHMKGEDGLYHINGKTYKFLYGKRAQVWHGTAYKTKGEKTKDAFLMNKRGRIVSRKQHTRAKKEKRLEKAGFFTQKGKFGYVKKTVKLSKSTKSRKSRKSGKTRKSKKH